jgi:dolichol-phosphate mannosyltransferase
MSAADGSRRPLLSVVSPVFNEQGTVPLFYERLTRALEPFAGELDVEIIFTNNRSTDGTADAVLALRARDTRVQLLTLSRNFGYEGSMVAGLRQAQGDAIVLIDVDCEDPPEMLQQFIRHWREGYDIVFGIRERRAEPTPVTWLRKVFYRVNKTIADSDVLVDVAEFALMTAPVRDAVVTGLSTFPFIRAEVAHYGFRRLGIHYDRQPRAAGRSNFSFSGMTKLAIAGILTSTTVPLRAPLYVLPLVFVLNALLLWMEAAGHWAMAFETLVSFDLLYIATTLTFVSLYTARNYRNVVGRPIAVVDWRLSAVNVPPEESPNFLPRGGPARR